MELASLKPWLAALAIPPALGICVLILACLLLLLRKPRLGALLGVTGLAIAWLTACSGFAIWVNTLVLPQVNALPANAIPSSLAAAKVQAIVVLGGGVESVSREYASPQPSPNTLARLHYGLHLARQSGLPVAFAGGLGWAGSGNSVTEARAVGQWLAQEGKPALTWLDNSSKDTAQNARVLAPMLRQSGVERIALVTHAWHMPRSLRAFEATGLHVLPAPMGFIESSDMLGLQWIPSSDGVRDNRRVWREALALVLGIY